MEAKLWAVVIGIIAGALGYWITTFWMQPILRYRSIRNRVLMDFIYYAQVVNADGLNEEMQQLFRERVLANRKASAELSAATLDLPFWYSRWLRLKGMKPRSAAKHLIGYSNTREHDQAGKVETAIRRDLGLPPET